jgi:hypothetical protein
MLRLGIPSLGQRQKGVWSGKTLLDADMLQGQQAPAL